MRTRFGRTLPTVAAALCLFAACDPEDTRPDYGVNAGSSIVGGQGGTGKGLPPFVPVHDPGPGGVIVTASGEELALTGYPFPPPTADSPVFVDGWDVTFDRVLVTIGRVTFAANPDKVKGNQAATDGVVAEADGPWAVDLHHTDPTDLPGKAGGGERAVPIAALGSENANGGKPFPTDGTRLAFGFDVVAATPEAANVNLDDAGVADYLTMIDGGCTVLYVGTATFNGDASCNPPETYGNWPKRVRFRFCFRSPTSYANCQNPDNDPAGAIDGEEHARGVAFTDNASVVAQATLHVDHPFWDSVVHDSPAHFDAYAARAVGAPGALVASGSDANVPLVTLDDMRGVDYSAVTDSTGRRLSWRYCAEPNTSAHPKLTGVMSYDPQSVPHAPGNDPSTGFRDFYDFVTYTQSTQGHLNADGLCYVARKYPSPP